MHTYFPRLCLFRLFSFWSQILALTQFESFISFLGEFFTSFSLIESLSCLISSFTKCSFVLPWKTDHLVFLLQAITIFSETTGLFSKIRPRLFSACLIFSWFSRIWICFWSTDKFLFQDSVCPADLTVPL